MTGQKLTPSRDLKVTVRKVQRESGTAMFATIVVPDDYNGQGERAQRRLRTAAAHALETPTPTYIGMHVREDRGFDEPVFVAVFRTGAAW